MVALRVLLYGLVEQLAVPAVQRPHKERRAWSSALHLHAPFISEIRCAASARCRHKVEFFFPHAHRAGGYRCPALHFCHLVVIFGYHHIVKVVVVGYHLCKHCLLLHVGHLGGVRVLELLADEHHSTLLLVFVELHVQSPRVLWQAVWPCVRYARKCRSGFLPELAQLYFCFALTYAVAVRPLYTLSESVHDGAVVGIFRLLLVAQVPAVGQHIVGVKLHGLAVGLHTLHKGFAFGLFLQVGVASVNFRFVLQWQTIHGKQRRSTIAATTNLCNLRTSAQILHSVSRHNATDKFGVAYT